MSSDLRAAPTPAVAANGPARASDLSRNSALVNGTPRIIDFTTDQGTQISVDVSPDGKHIVFDLLGHVYSMSAGGGPAGCLTQATGVALNYHPRFSPDGQWIAFISDRSGQANVWIMRTDGTEARVLYRDDEHRYASPVWSADGQTIFATRYAPTPGQGWHRRSASIWRIPLRGAPQPVLISTTRQYYVSSASRDGHAIYLYSSEMAREGASIYEVGFHIQALDLSNRKLTDLASAPVTAPVAGHPAASAEAANRPQLSYDSGGPTMGSADVVPIVSPDGRFLAFARALPSEPMTIRGHRYRPSTGLFVLDLHSSTARRVLAPITKDQTNAHAHYTDVFLPSFAWTPDSRSLVISVNGKIVRVSVEDSRVRDLPFTAVVHRVISDQVRHQARFDPDDAVPVRFIQWPTGSPDGRRLVFVALGRLWVMDLPNGPPRPLTPNPGANIQITPAWSPDGGKVAFATWNERERGQIWTFDFASASLARESNEPGEYIWPTWTSSGELIAVRGPSVEDPRDAWNAEGGWQAVRLSRVAPAAFIVDVGTPWQPLQIGPGGRIFFTSQWDSRVWRRLELPYPDAAARELGAWNVLSVDASGNTPRMHASFPAGPRSANVPAVSPGAKRITYQADYQIFVENIDASQHSQQIAYIDPNPHHERPGKQRADEEGGVYPRWHDDHTIEFASGDRYVTFDVDKGTRRVFPISLHFPRDRARGSLALLDARIITMDGDRVIPKGALVVRDGRIVCVGECSTKGVDRVLNLAGKTVIPGLVDVHDHIASELNGIVPLRRPASLLALAYGVTTIIDPSVPSTTLFPLAEMTDEGRALGPRTFGSADPVFGSVGGPDGTFATTYGPLLDIRSQADADYEVARRAAWGAMTIKNYRLTSRQQQQWLVDAARKYRLSMTAEGSYLLADLGMVMDGQTGWEHFLPTFPLYKDIIEFMGRAHANYSPTLSVAGFPDGAMFYFRPRAKLQEDPKFGHFASRALLKSVTPRDAAPPPLDEFAFPILAEGVADIVHAGGFATIGEHGENPGIGSHWEIWVYAGAMKPIEALRMATLFGARTVGLDRDLGSLTTGKLADLVVLNSNPLERIENTADIAYVMKGGRLYDPVTLNELTLPAR